MPCRNSAPAGARSAATAMKRQWRPWKMSVRRLKPLSRGGGRAFFHTPPPCQSLPSGTGRAGGSSFCRGLPHPGNRAEIRQHLRRQRRKHDDAARNPMRGAFLRYVRCSFCAGVCEGGGYCEWGEIDRGTDYAGARSEYRVKLKNVDIAERLYYFTKTII